MPGFSRAIPTLCLVLFKDYVLGSVNQFEVQEDGQHIFSHYTPQLGPLQKSLIQRLFLLVGGLL